MKLIIDEIRKIELDYFNDILKSYPYLIVQGEHYRLLTYISYLYNNILIIDAGTCQGHSCLALAQNTNNTVYTYDTYDMYPKYTNNITNEHKNVIKYIKDINLESDYVFESSKIILLDIDPHDGDTEIKFYNRLLNINFNGFLICDDININNGMKKFWNTINKEKYDITEIGHCTGTGIVNFSNEKIEIL